MVACPNCGGKMYFNIPEQQLKCEYCGSDIPVENYKEDNSAVEYTDMNVYSCKQCGAEILCDDDAMVTYCSYCGSEAVLKGRVGGENPSTVIPFQISKEQCKEKYEVQIRTLPFVPKELKKAEFLEKFRGIYIPYKQYDFKYDQHYDLPATQKETIGNYEYTKKITVTLDSEGQIINRQFDLSAGFDDNIARRIGSFNTEAEKAFHPGYLAGFYADKTNVEESQYDSIAQEDTDAAVCRDFQSTLSRQGITLDVDTEDQKKLFQGKPAGKTKKLFPVWFLTWRKKDRVSYVIMNGQSGELSADLPVDTASFGLTAAIVAVILFFLLNLVLSITAKSVLPLCSIMACVALYIFYREIRKLMYKENHIYDRGYRGKDVRMPSEKVQKLRNRQKGVGSIGSHIIAVLSVGIGLFFGISLELSILSIVICPILALWMFIKIAQDTKYIDEKTEAMTSLISLVCIALAGGISLIEPVADYWYYGGSILCMLSSLLLCLTLIHCYNKLATRSIPSFFQREGGKNDEKD